MQRRGVGSGREGVAAVDVGGVAEVSWRGRRKGE